MECLLTLGVGCSVLWCVSLSPLGSCRPHFCLRPSTDSSTLWLSLCFAFGHRRSLLVSTWPLCCDNFDGDSVCLSPCEDAVSDFLFLVGEFLPVRLISSGDCFCLDFRLAFFSLDWSRDLHESLLLFKLAINFIAPRFGLALEIFQYSPNIFIDLDWFPKQDLQSFSFSRSAHPSSVSTVLLFLSACGKLGSYLLVSISVRPSVAETSPIR